MFIYIWYLVLKLSNLPKQCIGDTGTAVKVVPLVGK